jgi:hypothetical protein
MKFKFYVDDTLVKFSWNWFTGSTKLAVNSEKKILQSSFEPSTHISVQLKKQWHQSIMGHEIIIEKERHRLLAGFRPQIFRVFVDNVLIEEKKGF